MKSSRSTRILCWAHPQPVSEKSGFRRRSRSSTPRRQYSFYIEDSQLEGLERVKERDGVLESEQIRRAIDAWLEKKGVKKIERKRVRSRNAGRAAATNR